MSCFTVLFHERTAGWEEYLFYMFKHLDKKPENVLSLEWRNTAIIQDFQIRTTGISLLCHIEVLYWLDDFVDLKGSRAYTWVFFEESLIKLVIPVAANCLPEK